MHRKAQLIEGIIHINRSAEPDWLARFDASALARYLAHLHQALEPRGGGSYWPRDGETPAIVTRRPTR